MPTTTPITHTTPITPIAHTACALLALRTLGLYTDSPFPQHDYLQDPVSLGLACLVVALLTAVAVQTQTSANESVTIIRNAGQPDMEVVVREQGKEVRFKGAGSAAQGQGVRAGVAYKLEDGNIVYIPETGAAPASASASGAGGAATPAPAKP